MAYRLYRKRAERDLDNLAACITPDSFDGLCDAIESLGEFPKRGPLVRDATLRKRGVRQALYGEGHSIYRILYRLRDESVEILTIRHGRRRPTERI